MAGNHYLDDDLDEITSEGDDLISRMTSGNQNEWNAKNQTGGTGANQKKRTGGSRLVESSKKKKSGGGKGLVVLLIILLLLIAVLAVGFWKMNSSDGDLSSLMFWKSHQQEETLPPSTESLVPETEPVEEDETSVEESPETSDSLEEAPEVSMPGSESENADLPLMQVIPNGFSSGLTTVNYDGVEQADAPVSLDKSILESIQNLLAAAAEAATEGGYDTTETLRLHAFKVATGDPEGEIAEHDTGLAVDFETYENQHVWEFASAAPNTSAWLQEHAHEYGFILRFPEDKVSTTGVSYQPWHYTYVGVTIATEMYENDWCLEEYLAR